MNFGKRFMRQISNISQAYTRYPLTMLMFIILFILNAWYIVDEFSGYERVVQSILVLIFLSLVATHINERFITNRMQRWGILIASVVLSIGYYAILPSNDSAFPIYEVKTSVLIFALFIAFIWIPTIKNNIRYFYEMFLAIFKYSFVTLLYGGILTLGVQAIISSIDLLLFSISYDYFIHAANFIWIVVAPSYFLSLIPLTLNYFVDSELARRDTTEAVAEQETTAFEAPNFLQILINYIVIPLVGIYTIILVVYILLNIRGEFWSDNLLEPMLISYAIVVIITYLLACNMTQPIARYFRKIFPKILIPIVLFQSIASILEIQNMGITYGRYYVILFGVFAIIAGIIFSFFRKEKTGWIVPILVILTVISIIPPIDAFTVGKNSQKEILTNTLTENKMLKQDQITPNPDVSRKAKERITSSVNYLTELEYIDEIAYFDDNFNAYDNFEDVFGFSMTYPEIDNGDFEELTEYVSLERPTNQVMSIANEDYFLQMYLSNYEEEPATTTIEINSDYTMRVENTGLYFMIDIEDQAGEEVLQIDLEALFTQAFAASIAKEQVVNEADMTLKVENDELGIRILAFELMKNEEEQVVNADIYIFIDVKNP